MNDPLQRPASIGSGTDYVSEDVHRVKPVDKDSGGKSRDQFDRFLHGDEDGDEDGGEKGKNDTGSSGLRSDLSGKKRSAREIRDAISLSETAEKLVDKKSSETEQELEPDSGAEPDKHHIDIRA